MYGDREELGFDNLLQLDASLAWPTTVVSLGYGPRFGVARVLDGSMDTQITFLHNFDVGLQLRKGRFTFDLGQDATFGQQSFGQLYGLPQTATVAASGSAGAASAPSETMTTDPNQLPPGVGNPVRLSSGVQIYAFRTTAAMTYLWSRRWESTVDLGYSYSGAENPEIETVDGRAELLNYPRIQIANGETTLMYDVTRRERAGVELGGQRGWSDRDNYGLASLAAKFSLAWTTHTNLEVRAGAAYRSSLDLNREREKAIVPVGSFNVSHSIDSHTLRARFQVNMTYEPAVNVLQAALQDRLTGLASASLATHWDSITLSLSGSQSFPPGDPEAAMFAGGSLAYDHQFSRWVDIEVGGQLVKQVTNASVSSGTVWTVYVGLGAQISPVRF